MGARVLFLYVTASRSHCGRWEGKGGGQNISCGNQSSRELSSSDSSIEMTSGETGRKMKRVGNRGKCSKKYQLENLFDCCNFLSGLLKGMTRENWWGWQNINCQPGVKGGAPPGLELVSRHAFCQIKIATFYMTIISFYDYDHIIILVWSRGLLAGTSIMATFAFCHYRWDKAVSICLTFVIFWHRSIFSKNILRKNKGDAILRRLICFWEPA